MKLKLTLRLLYVAAFFFFISCGPSRNLAYFSDLQQEAVLTQNTANYSDPKLQPDDLLSITVSSQNPESDALFNRDARPAVVRTNEIATQGYLIDKSGFVDLPVIGRVKLAGLTKQEAKETLSAKLQDYLKDPIVDIRFLNFRVTVVGEVNRPSTFTIPSEKINVLEALGLAGDMTAYGKRENVLLIREAEGVQHMVRLNLNSKDVLKSPYFYLQQNDVIYVEPDRMKEVQASTNTRFLTILTASVSIASIIIARLF